MPTKALLSYEVMNWNGITAKSDISIPVSLIKADQSESSLKITTRHDRALKLDL